ncbi:MAG TPA: TolC family outer membrane protein [Burkholderiales bacterium]|nr:TolC family outer membrane protein [Burkholderiales bacterium]
MRNRFKLCALSVALALFPSAHAADLLDTYRQAKQNDAVFAAARSQYEADQERLPQGRALLLPRVDLSADTNLNDGQARAQPSLSFPTGGREWRYNDHGWNITLTQPIFRWQNVMEYRQSAFAVQQAGAIFGQAEQDLIVRVAEAYFDVLAAQDNIDFVRANKTAISEQLAQAKRNFEVGTATITDTNEAQARYDLAVSQEIAAVNALEIARRALEQITNAEQPLAPLKPNVQLPPPTPNDMTQWVGSALYNNFGVKANEAALEIANREIEKQRAGHYPTVDAFATYSEDKTNQTISGTAGNDRLRTEGSIIGLQLNVPLFEGFAVNSRTRQAVALRERARSDLETARRSAQFNARQSFLNVNSGLAQTQALEQAVVSSETALKSNRVGYEVGVRINIDVLNAQQQLFQTQRDLSRARYDTIINGLRLKAAAGTLMEEDVQQVNRLLAGN